MQEKNKEKLKSGVIRRKKHGDRPTLRDHGLRNKNESGLLFQDVLTRLSHFFKIHYYVSHRQRPLVEVG